MKPFTIVLPDRVGLISDISYILGKERINIDGLDATVVGKKIVITFLVKNTKRAAEVLAKNGYKNLEEDYVVVKIPDAPGEMAKMTSMLKERGINILNLHQISADAGEALVALKTNKPRATRTALKGIMASDLE